MGGKPNGNEGKRGHNPTFRGLRERRKGIESKKTNTQSVNNEHEGRSETEIITSPKTRGRY